MADKAYKVRGVVKKVISVGPGGGAIIALHRARLDTVRVVISHDMIGERPYAGEVLLVQGHYQVHPVYDEQLHATAVHAACPTIHELAGLIGRHPSFAYMSVRRARHLVSSDGQAFLDALENGDLEYLMDARFELQNAVALIQQWKRYWARKRTAELLVKGGIAPTFANELLRLYGYDADRRIRQDPFKLVPFCTWTAVDEFSRKVSDTANSSNRRLIAAARDGLDGN
ncbi:helix-hairpin-helix domain-containing protein [Paraburkholderia bryophila]|uniref:Uncharacterized protein n=1 Tax=Paraburkholderia bryophila TaxID=420952 RepID=A0A7Y9WFD8_9BURK|nr:helix-hairpin-helix domain-containing protein [Paraburkholderia bryophila]NYH18878.1 hypothetical protein [Paraburkholderia bryophila]